MMLTEAMKPTVAKENIRKAIMQLLN
jgi:hypothetical protein